MEEKERIQINTNGELPKGQKTIISVSNIDNAKEVLDVCKKSVLAVLENSDIENDSKDWETILPEIIVSFSKSLSSDDFAGDDFVMPIRLWIYSMRHPDIKIWEWYSSKLTDHGFQIVTTNSAFIPLITLIHMQRIPLRDIYVEDDRFGSYTPIALKDTALNE